MATATCDSMRSGAGVKTDTEWFPPGKMLLMLPVLLALALCAVGRADDKRVEHALRKVDRVVTQGPFRPSWDSLETYQVPRWYLDAKFGIFIHWGVFAVSAYDDWYARNMYLQGHAVFKHHIETYGPQSKFHPRTTATCFD